MWQVTCFDNHWATNSLVWKNVPRNFSPQMFYCSLDRHYGFENFKEKNKDKSFYTSMHFVIQPHISDNDGKTAVNANRSSTYIDSFCQTRLRVLHFSLFLYKDDFYKWERILTTQARDFIYYIHRTLLHFFKMQGSNSCDFTHNNAVLTRRKSKIKFA